MNEGLEFIVRSVLIGAGATVVMDIWAVFIKRCFGIPSLNYSMVGRWIGHIPKGKLIHTSILQATPVKGESGIGWFAHYLIGIIFAGLLLSIMGPDWAENPTFLPALVIGIVTLVAPYFIMQPGMGMGIAASKTPAPTTARLRSLMAHTSYGVGLYLTALLLTLFP
ncbi:DUF2938 domain-containing protein [Xenorhabdus hominickii]|uniref:Membrane protein n=1 Tax=Xenorhabdus hominickii TaxID=351679 RepID=A0A2G0Q8H5_XENHO|nr:DUF2938 domain-containing protein [Xenorhabdus hominickii]AOM41232.1 hypothetical protein A9255_11955 [Xenorhabdus hominickii]PHM55516.1 membrane protein [Xenorhabdus hominickii]PHM57119.1 membrane protein [Xenorhabdus hominickii]